MRKREPQHERYRQPLVDYALILVLVAAVATVVLLLLGDRVSAALQPISTRL